MEPLHGHSKSREVYVFIWFPSFHTSYQYNNYIIIIRHLLRKHFFLFWPSSWRKGQGPKNYRLSDYIVILKFSVSAPASTPLRALGTQGQPLYAFIIFLTWLTHATFPSPRASECWNPGPTKLGLKNHKIQKPFLLQILDSKR